MTTALHALLQPAPHCAGTGVRAGRAALQARAKSPELAFKVKGSPAVLSTAVRERHRG